MIQVGPRRKVIFLQKVIETDGEGNTSKPFFTEANIDQSKFGRLMKDGDLLRVEITSNYRFDGPDALIGEYLASQSEGQLGKAKG